MQAWQIARPRRRLPRPGGGLRARAQPVSGEAKPATVVSRPRFRRIPGVATAADRVERQFHRDQRDELCLDERAWP